MKKLILLLTVYTSAFGAFSNATRITANATQGNRPFTLFPTFAYDEICDYPKPFIDGSAPAAWQVDIYSRWPASARCTSGSVKKAYVSFHLSVTSGVTYTVDYRDNANPCHLGNLATCQAAAYDQAGFLALSWSATMSLSPAPTSTGATTQVVNARTMLSGGLWSYRLRGPVVTQLKVEDTSTARSTDFGWREKRAARLTEDLLNGDTSFQVSADWSGLTRPFKVQLGYEIVSVCYASYNSGTGNSTLTVGTTNGSNTSCATTLGRGQDGTGAYNHYYLERRESVRLWSNSPFYHVSGITSSYTTTLTVNDAATINNVTLLKAGFELFRVCNKSGNTLTVGIGAWPCTANVSGRTWWGTRRAVQVNDNDGGSYPVNGVLDNWSELTDVWVDAENDRYKSLHPVFILTAYPSWTAVGIEYHIANTWHDRLQDQYYTISLSPAGVTIPEVLHKAMTIWKYPDGPTVGTFGTGLGDRKVWDGTAPASVRLDYNLPYLRYAGVVPHDPDVQINSSAIATLLGTTNRSHDGTTYAWENSDKGAIPRGALWLNQNHRDNCALEYKYLGNPGGRPDIAPIPFWHSTALYAMSSSLTDADRWAEALFGVAACSGYVPYHVWEGDTDTSRKFCAASDTTLDSCTGSNALVAAFYRPWSIDARPESFLTFDQSQQGDATKRLLYQGDQSYANWGIGDGNAHWPSHNFIPWLLSGDWYYERGQLDEGARSLMFANSNATSRRGSWGLPDWYNMSRPISWHIRNITLAAWASVNGSPEEAYFTDKINKWIEFQEGRYNITDGQFYNPCSGGPSDKTSTPWCYGRRTEQNDAPTTESGIPYFGGVASWGWNDWGNVLQAYTYHVKSAWMDNYGLASMGWGYNLGFTQFGPILDRVYLRNNVYLLLHPSVNPFNIGEYRDPAIPCRPEGVAASPDCRSQTFAAGEQRFYSDYASYQRSWNSTAQNKRALDNDGDEQGGYSTVHRATVAFADRVRNGAINGPRAWEFLKYAFNDTQGKTTGTPMWSFSPQSQHTIDIRTNPTGGGNFSFTFTAPNGGECSYLISSAYPTSSLTSSDTTVSGGTRDRKVTLIGQSAGTKYLRVTCGDSARSIVSFTQP